MTDSLTIVDVFEEVLEVKFGIDKIHGLDIPKLRKLAVRLQSFLESFNIPEKADGELRPFLSSRYTAANPLNKVFWTNNDPTGLKDISPQIKAYLLYCHGLCFDEGLIYILGRVDAFYPEPCGCNG